MKKVLLSVFLCFTLLIFPLEVKAGALETYLKESGVWDNMQRDQLIADLQEEVPEGYTITNDASIASSIKNARTFGLVNGRNIGYKLATDEYEAKIDNLLKQKESETLNNCIPIIFFVVLVLILYIFLNSEKKKELKACQNERDHFKKLTSELQKLPDREEALSRKRAELDEKEAFIKKQINYFIEQNKEHEKKLIELDRANATLRAQKREIEEGIAELDRLKERQSKKKIVEESKRQFLYSRDPVNTYLTFEEYTELSERRRNQLALTRYHERRKTGEEIGRDYELYVSYQYRQEGYFVEEHGVANGFKDGGIDLIAMNGKKVLVIQCKYWASGKVIHENIVKQLAGSAEAYRRENNLRENQVLAVLVTNIKLAEDAKQAAFTLGIQVRENNPIKKYPSIKCAVRRMNGANLAKKYYLPFDPEYNHVKIEYQGDAWMNTVDEAEKNGFKRSIN